MTQQHNRDSAHERAPSAPSDDDYLRPTLPRDPAQRESPTPVNVRVARFGRAIAARARTSSLLAAVIVALTAGGEIFGGTGAALFLGTLSVLVAARWIVICERLARARRGEGRFFW